METVGGLRAAARRAARPAIQERGRRNRPIASKAGREATQSGSKTCPATECDSQGGMAQCGVYRARMRRDERDTMWAQAERPVRRPTRTISTGGRAAIKRDGARASRR